MFCIQATLRFRKFNFHPLLQRDRAGLKNPPQVSTICFVGSSYIGVMIKGGRKLFLEFVQIMPRASISHNIFQTIRIFDVTDLNLNTPEHLLNLIRLICDIAFDEACISNFKISKLQHTHYPMNTHNGTENFEHLILYHIILSKIPCLQPKTIS
jgi:hypothetical protein